MEKREKNPKEDNKGISLKASTSEANVQEDDESTDNDSYKE